MSQWTPEWSVSVNGSGDVTNLVLSNLTITSGRTDIYSQAQAGYCSVDIINLDESPINIDVNDSIIIKVKDSTGTYVNLFGGDVTDINVTVQSSGSGGINQVISLIALGALAKLPKILTEGVLVKAYDGTQISDILVGLLAGQWNEVPAAETWAAYNPSTTWLNAENSGIGQIDTPGNYELTARSANVTDTYSLVAALATSGLGYIYEDASGRIGYADSTRRTNYLGTYGYTQLSANNAIGAGLRTTKRIGDVRNSVTIKYKNNAQVTATDTASQEIYGQVAQIIQTSIEKTADATSQADFYLTLRAYPEAQFRNITFPIANPEIDDSDRDALLNVFMGLPLDITDLPMNMENGRFQGFVEGWTFRASYNGLSLTLNLSPTAYSLQAMRWNDVSGSETWNTLSGTMDWNEATIVA